MAQQSHGAAVHLASMRTAITFDLDGTICNHEHRLHHVLARPKEWEEFHDKCVDDTPNYYITRLLAAVYDSPLDVFLCSGRPDSHRTVTERWLAHAGVKYHTLLMRKAGDRRPDVVAKFEMLQQIRATHIVLCAIDDRPSVLRMWRANGVPTLAVEGEAWDMDREEQRYVSPHYS